MDGRQRPRRDAPLPELDPVRRAEYARGIQEIEGYLRRQAMFAEYLAQVRDRERQRRAQQPAAPGADPRRPPRPATARGRRCRRAALAAAAALFALGFFVLFFWAGNP